MNTIGKAQTTGLNNTETNNMTSSAGCDLSVVRQTPIPTDNRSSQPLQKKIREFDLKTLPIRQASKSCSLIQKEILLREASQPKHYSDPNVLGAELINAAKRDDKEKILELLASWSRSFGGTSASYSYNAMCWAAENGHKELLVALDNSGYKFSTFLMRPLEMAAERGQVEIVEMLLKKTIDQKSIDCALTIDQENIDRALIAATKEGHAKIVEMLLKQNVSLKVKEKALRNSYECKCQEKRFEVNCEYIKDGVLGHHPKRHSSTLIKASQRGVIRVVEILLDHVSHEHKVSALLLAAETGQLEVIKLLLKEDFTHSEKYRALGIAGKKNRVDVYFELLRSGAAKIGAVPEPKITTGDIVQWGKDPRMTPFSLKHICYRAAQEDLQGKSLDGMTRHMMQVSNGKTEWEKS